MIEQQKFRPASVTGPLGELLTLDALPSPNSTRWVIRRKAEVVSAVNGGLLSTDEPCERYGLTAEEFASWQQAVDHSGVQGGLRASATTVTFTGAGKPFGLLHNTEGFALPDRQQQLNHPHLHRTASRPSVPSF